MATERLELPDGQWADLLVKPRHAEYLAIIEAAERAEDGTGTWAEWALTIGQQYTTAWRVTLEGGDPAPLDDWSGVDPDITDAICTEAQSRWREWSANRRPLVIPRFPPRRSESKSETSESSSGDT